ncbi:hypothetical protein QTP70_009922 [Hemibagrus guttatus]|uniref:Uncharacterized protein n=1 Tax=Hemibagrus guttatus TaxID=175788 RepID=A0AAE0QA30_9TELE|nr:hypothetical protein QTP70_009922 [Hemibagrus guttatus]
MDYQITETNPADEGSFPQLDIAPDLDGSEGPLLECWGVRKMDFGLGFRCICDTLSRRSDCVAMFRVVVGLQALMPCVIEEEKRSVIKAVSFS